MSETHEAKSENLCLYEIIPRRYGSRLIPSELEEVLKILDQIRKAAEALRSVKLKNNDEPIIRFVPHERKPRMTR